MKVLLLRSILCRIRPTTILMEWLDVSKSTRVAAALINISSPRRDSGRCCFMPIFYRLVVKFAKSRKISQISSFSRKSIIAITELFFQYSLWVSCPFLKKNLCSPRPPTRHLRRNWTTTTWASLPTSWSPNRQSRVNKRLTSPSAIMPAT